MDYIERLEAGLVAAFGQKSVNGFIEASMLTDNVSGTWLDGELWFSALFEDEHDVRSEVSDR